MERSRSAAPTCCRRSLMNVNVRRLIGPVFGGALILGDQVLKEVVPVRFDVALEAPRWLSLSALCDGRYFCGKPKVARNQRPCKSVRAEGGP